MKTVRINREELLGKIKANREAHAKDYEEAMVGYRDTVVEKLCKALNEARAGGKLVTNLNLTEPITRVADYDRAIGMLEMSVDEVIELEAYDFDRYVLDNWEWKHLALTANAMYKTA